MANPKRTLERIYTPGAVEVRSRGSERFIEGYAALFDKPSQNLGGFIEVVRHTAFNKTVKEADVRALFNHDENLVLGRTRSGTLTLAIDNSGLYYRIVPPNTSYAADLMEMLERKDVDQSSFAFYSIQDDWGLTEQEFPQRELLDVALVDVSPVTYPAYLDTVSGIGGRSAALASLARRSGLSVADLDDPEAIKRILLDKQPPPEERAADAKPEPTEAPTEPEPEPTTQDPAGIPEWQAAAAKRLAELDAILKG